MCKFLLRIALSVDNF